MHNHSTQCCLALRILFLTGIGLNTPRLLTTRQNYGGLLVASGGGDSHCAYLLHLWRFIVYCNLDIW
ncbi:hypothetical protein M8C21_001353 [Ambrosia artemisiifolia]|uniref:Uncharacterized protein n=1 Tax=Ambrosia artemisiifolia TaxID=4212 RepID=A0AAD5C053_AMBAR|nr:hypothetical protein M8C21_001353 [Ambrosia artemisiifolia]